MKALLRVFLWSPLLFKGGIGTRCGNLKFGPFVVLKELSDKSFELTYKQFFLSKRPNENVPKNPNRGAAHEARF